MSCTEALSGFIVVQVLSIEHGSFQVAREQRYDVTKTDKG